MIQNVTTGVTAVSQHLVNTHWLHLQFLAKFITHMIKQRWLS